MPYGELLVDEHTSSEDLPYKFNGKELDEETGLYYYGARYMQPIASIWYGIDPLTEKYPDVSAYAYCMGNPVKLVDSDGNEPDGWTRVWGAAQMIGGAVEMVGSGVGECLSSGTAPPIAIPIFLNGMDNFQAGFKQLWTGEEQQTFLHKGVSETAKSLGIDNGVAETIGDVVDCSTMFLGSGNGAKNIITKSVKPVSKTEKTVKVAVDVPKSSLNNLRQKAVRQAWRDEKNSYKKQVRVLDFGQIFKLKNY